MWYLPIFPPPHLPTAHSHRLSSLNIAPHFHLPPRSSPSTRPRFTLPILSHLYIPTPIPTALPHSTPTPYPSPHPTSCRLRPSVGLHVVSSPQPGATVTSCVTVLLEEGLSSHDCVLPAHTGYQLSA